MITSYFDFCQSLKPFEIKMYKSMDTRIDIINQVYHCISWRYDVAYGIITIKSA